MNATTADKKNIAPLVCLISIPILAVFLIVICSNLFTNPSTPRTYVALGDSVSSGYGLINLEDSHPAVLFEMLWEENYVDEYINLAEDGLTTTLLLEQLRDMNKTELSYMHDARIITINIGGNNILMPFIGYLSELQVVSGADRVKTGAGDILSGAWDIISGIFTGIGSIFSDSIESRAGDIIPGAGELITGVGDILSGTGEIISGTPRAFSTFRGAFSPELEKKLEEGVQIFTDEFKEILELIENYAPRATVLINTVYNPIPQDVLKMSLEISNVANVLIDSINYVIIAESNAKRHLVIDVNEHFSNQLNMAQFNINPFAGSLSLDIIHPNPEGHNIIAQLQYAAFAEHSSSDK
jgi:lysophospholipase L1-like esterase